MSITKLQLSSLALLLLAMASPQNALASSPTLSVPGSTCYAMYSADEDHLYRSGGWVVNMSPDKSIWVECPLVLMEGSVTDGELWVVDNNSNASKNVDCSVWHTQLTSSNPYTGSVYRIGTSKKGAYFSQSTPVGMYFLSSLWSGGNARIQCSLPPLYNGLRSGITGFFWYGSR